MKRQIARILGMNRRTFGLVIFENLIQREEIHHTGSIKKCQPLTCKIILLFYRHKKRDDHIVIDRIDRKRKCDLIHADENII